VWVEIYIIHEWIQLIAYYTVQKKKSEFKDMIIETKWIQFEALFREGLDWGCQQQR